MPRKVTPTYVLLNQITLVAASSSVDFSNIPQNYSDLILIYKGNTSANIGVGAKFNNDSSNQSRVVMYGSGSGSGTSDTFPTSNEILYSGSGQSNALIHIMDYSATDKHKTILSRSTAPAVLTMATALRWASTAAINSVALTPNSSNTFAIGSTFSLYGVIA